MGTSIKGTVRGRKQALPAVQKLEKEYPPHSEHPLQRAYNATFSKARLSPHEAIKKVPRKANTPESAPK